MVLGASTVRETARAIAAAQTSDGAIPWFPGDQIDPWNHIEAAMALDVSGFHKESGCAYEWLVRRQRADGSWFAFYQNGGVKDYGIDANFCAYAAVGAWHHFLATDDLRFLRRIWPVVEKAIGFVLELQTDDGAILWARDPDYRPATFALLTSSSSIYMSLRCALTIADFLGESRPDWELALDALGRAVAFGSESFRHKDHYSMDWYYPVLTGILDGERGRQRIFDGWSHFVVDGLGARCVIDRPWITSAETCELVMALDAAGLSDEACSMFDSIHWLRADDGAYWTGGTFPELNIWPREKTTWSAAAVLLAADALGYSTNTSGIFRGETLFEPFDLHDAVPDAL